MTAAAMNWRRGLFRLWLVLSVLWIGVVGVITWWKFPVDDWVVVSEEPDRNPPPPGFTVDKPPFDPSKPFTIVKPRPHEFDPDEYLASKRAEDMRALTKERHSAIWFASILALLPPALVLALGSALVWAFRGFTPASK